MRTPSGSASSDDSAGANTPFTNTIVGQSVAPNVNAAKSSALTSPPGVERVGYSASAIRPTLVKCQSSFLVVGKPNASNRSIAQFRTYASQSGSALPADRANC